MYLFTAGSPPDAIERITLVCPDKKDMEPSSVDPSCIAYRSLLLQEKKDDCKYEISSDNDDQSPDK